MMASSTLLAAWELAGSQAPLQRALTLLAAAWPERAAWQHVPIGERDRHLLALYTGLFGTRIDGLATCPRCAEQLEVRFDTGQIAAPAWTGHTAVGIEVDGYRISCRLPDSADLLAVVAAGEPAHGLLERCITGAMHDGAAVAPAALPPVVRAALEEALRDADPQAEVSIALDCPACGHAWVMDFDVLAYLWSEIEDWAARLLRDVHDLASAYGWSEAAILALGDARRRWYLELVAPPRPY